MKKQERQQIEAALLMAVNDIGLDLDHRQLAAQRLMVLRLNETIGLLDTVASRLGWLVFVFVVLPILFVAGSLVLGACGLFVGS